MQRTRFSDDRSATRESTEQERHEPLTVEQVARRFARLNVVIGLVSFLGPAVTGNDDRVINRSPGYLFGVIAVNWLHALIHVVYGLVGLGSGDESARQYLEIGAVFWGAMAAMGYGSFGFERGIHMVAGMALDVWGTTIHLFWAVIGVVGVALPSQHQSDGPT